MRRIAPLWHTARKALDQCRTKAAGAECCAAEAAVKDGFQKRSCSSGFKRYADLIGGLWIDVDWFCCNFGDERCDVFHFVEVTRK
jgi:hypothetical protein